MGGKLGSKELMIKNITGINLLQNNNTSCDRCSSSVMVQVVSDDEIKKKKISKKKELSKHKVSELREMCNEMKVRDTGVKMELRERISEASYVTKINEKKIEEDITSIFKSAKEGHSPISYLYRRYFNQVDRFNVLFYKYPPSIYKGSFQGKWLLDILHIMKLNLYALYQEDRLNRRYPINPEKLGSFLKNMCSQLTKK